MTEQKWVMNRAGLLNFWYYDDEIFHFSDGKLLLRGANGSGKSVTMQSFLPVLLDGKKTPDRLDPFGSKARRMEDYLLGEKEVVNRDERTGYLFLEYKKEGVERYITIGIGMQAKRNKGIKSWYFVITDNRRIKIDLELAHNHLGDCIPFSAKELENRISDGGYVVHTQREYMELVNKYIFGFQSLEAYEDLIKLLIQLRSPKLSKDFKPTVIYEILESALPPLTDDELRHLSDTIESMDQTEQQLEQLEREYESSSRLVKQYNAYNQYILAERSQEWARARRRCEEANKEVKRLEIVKEQFETEIHQLEEDKRHFTMQKEINESEKERLQNHEVWRLEKNKAEKTELVNRLNEEINQLHDKWEQKNNQYKKVRQDKDNTEEELLKLEKDWKALLEDLSLDAEEAAFSQHTINVEDLERHQQSAFDFSVWLKEIEAHEGLLRNLQQLVVEKTRLVDEHHQLERKSSEKKKEIDELRKNIDHLQEWFTEVKQKLDHQVIAWIEAHPKLSFSSECLQEITRSIEGLYELNRYEDVREKLYVSINDYITKMKTEKNLIEKAIDEKQKEINEADVELHYWKTLKMPNPDRAKDTQDFREKLTEDGQAFIPFYAAVEFQEHVTVEQKERIEAALKQIGLLDSLITEKALTPTHDRIIRTEPVVFGYTLADYLKPDVDEDSPISKVLVDEVLRSISLEAGDGGFHIDVDGTYSIGCMIGHAPDEGPSKYIGRTSRKRYQQEKIQEWEAFIQQLQQQHTHLSIQVREIDEALHEAERWKQTIPSDQELYELNEQIEKNRNQLEQQKAVLQQLDEEWKKIHQKLEHIKLQLHQQKGQLNLSLTKETLAEALEAIIRYRDFTYRLKSIHENCHYHRKRIEELEDRIHEIEGELDDIKGEQNIKESLLNKEAAEIKSIEQQLQLKGINEIRERIQQVLQALQEAEEKIATIFEELPTKKEKRNTCLQDLEKAKQSASFWSSMEAEWEKLVKLEVSHGFVKLDGLAGDDLLPAAIVSVLQDVLTKYERSKLNEQLTKTYLNEQAYLTEYRMFEYTEEAERPDWFELEWGDYYEPFMNEWSQYRSRRLIQMEYRGQRVSPYHVHESLQQELAEQKGWLDEQDRQLYEDIIVNTVGVILRNRIQRAEKWVREMDKIMESRDNSSGLTFSISWKPLTAESEQELDTKDLVQLLQRNSKFLNEGDLDRITKHFRSRITKAKELIQLRNEGSTLHQVLKEVLDYRKWFTFVLYYKRVNEPKRELTNNAFFKFSGGEKAMAMYIPLFTAAYSRYKEAALMAPYIISLDEAFAGVDENNIRDMFEVVEQLGFNYIMNSQALWGDYDTISSLSICELVRPKNADFVTVIRYQWDGKERTLVFDVQEEGNLEEEPIGELLTNES